MVTCRQLGLESLAGTWLPVDREAWSPWSGRVYLLKAGWPGVLGQHVVDSTQLGVYLQAEVTYNLHTNLLSPYCNFHYLKKYNLGMYWITA